MTGKPTSILNAPLRCIADALLRREISPTELVVAALQQTKSLSWLGAFVHVDEDGAKRRAIGLEREFHVEHAQSALRGIPFGIKDIFLTQDMPTRAGSRVEMTGIATGRDSAIVERLTSLGCVPIGKCATYEFATGGPSFDLPDPPALNPWDITRTTGGSSSGSAVSVATNMVPFALGTDTGGSLRTPASYCGIASFRPTPGRISAEGILPLAPRFDAPGVMAARIDDCRWVMDAIIGAEPKAIHGALTGAKPLDGLTVGVPRDLGTDVRVSADMSAAVDRILARCETLGAKVIQISVPPMWDFTVAFRTLMLAEAYAIHRSGLTDCPERYGRAFRYRVGPGRLVTPEDTAAADALSRHLRRTVEGLFAHVNLIVLPAAYGPPPRLDRMKLSDNFAVPQLTTMFTIGGNPVVTVPVATTSDGLPLGVQIGAAAGNDELVLDAAACIEIELGFDRLRSEMPARLSCGLPEPPPTPALDPPIDQMLIEADTAFDRLRGRLVGRTETPVRAQ